MKVTTLIFALALISSFQFTLYSQDVTTITAPDSISENLDLDAVASIFGESKDLEDFEKRINDPETKISNLDLNGDGEVDYIRVVESSKDETHLITLQAVIGKDLYQDVAVIDVEKDNSGETTVQVIGDVSMYGSSYIIEPVYVHRPVIYVWFWGPYYNPWFSPYYWGYYPPYYHPWTPYSPYRYHSHVRMHINAKNSYRQTTIRRSHTSKQLQIDNRRNDYENGGYLSNQSRNARLSTNTKTRSIHKSTNTATRPNTQKKVYKTSTSPKQRRVTKSAQKSSTKPSAKSVNKQSARSVNKTSKQTTNTAKTQTKTNAKPAKSTATKKYNKSGGEKRR